MITEFEITEAWRGAKYSFLSLIVSRILLLALLMNAVSPAVGQIHGDHGCRDKITNVDKSSLQLRFLNRIGEKLLFF